MFTFVPTYPKLIKIADMTMVIAVKVDFRIWNITTDKEGYHTIIKRMINREHVLIL